MSKVGKKSIILPKGVSVEKDKDVVRVTGPRGKIDLNLNPILDLEIDGSELKVVPKKSTKNTSALWGTNRALLQNAVNGVSDGFEKKLIIEGIGYGAQAQAKIISLKVGYIKPVELEIPEDLTVKVEKNLITINGINKETVGQFAALVRKQKPPEPYKGKGIRYEKEVIRRKAGKKVAGTTA